MSSNFYVRNNFKVIKFVILIDGKYIKYIYVVYKILLGIFFGVFDS